MKWVKWKAISANPVSRELNCSAVLQEANLCSGYRARFGLIDHVVIFPHPLVMETRRSSLMPGASNQTWSEVSESNQSSLMEPCGVQNKCVYIACFPLNQRVTNSQAMYSTFWERWWGCSCLSINCWRDRCLPLWAVDWHRSISKV